MKSYKDPVNYQLVSRRTFSTKGNCTHGRGWSSFSAEGGLFDEGWWPHLSVSIRIYAGQAKCHW